MILGGIVMQQAVEIISRGNTLRGMIIKPDNILGKIPVVLLLHGFGGNKMGPHFIFVKLCRLLERMGIASVRFDFAGSGESDGDFSNMTISDELKDAQNILNFIKSLDFIDKTNIAVLGFSMGGAIASILASENKEDIHSLCLWSPAGNMGEIVINHWIGDKYNDALINGYYDYEGDVMGKAFLKDISKLNIYEKSKGFDKNILIIHGDCDEVIPYQASLKYLDLYGHLASLNLITGANHMFDKKEWQQELIQKTILFFNDEFKLNKKA